MHQGQFLSKKERQRQEDIRDRGIGAALEVVRKHSMQSGAPTIPASMSQSQRDNDILDAIKNNMSPRAAVNKMQDVYSHNAQEF